jgi:YidC/Oxa1 family membrane protein insertase
MDIQRLVLLGALGISAYMLILAWNEDYNTPSYVEPSTTQQSTPAAPSIPVAELPADPSRETAGNQDIPAVVPVTQEAVISPMETASSSQYIQVHSDTLNFTIGLKGGDVVHVSLPEYAVQVETPDVPLTLLEQSNIRTYIAQSGLIGPNGPDSNPDGRPLYRADFSEYNLEEGENELSVRLKYIDSAGVEITKTFVFTRGSYLVEVQYQIDNRSADPWLGNFFAQIKRDDSDDPGAAASFGAQAYLGTALFTPDKPYTKFDFDDIAEQPFKQNIEGGWISMIQHYFISAWIPSADSSHLYQTRKVANTNQYIIGFTDPVLTVQPGASAATGAQFFVGPKIQSWLEEISPGLELTIDYGWLWFIAQPLFWLLTFIQGIVSNWGVAIILLTMCVKAAFFRLSATSYRSMAKMRQLQPKMLDIRERYSDDRQKMSQMTMQLYKDEKVNPLGGCLPILVQMPVFISLYWTLNEAVELRHAPFLWLTDLSAMDPYFVLPIIMGITMFIQQQLNPAPPDPIQAKMMKMMPIIFTFFFMWFPSGLVLYWLMNNLLSIAQQWVITRNIENESKKT